MALLLFTSFTQTFQFNYDHNKCTLLCMYTVYLQLRTTFFHVTIIDYTLYTYIIPHYTFVLHWKHFFENCYHFTRISKQLPFFQRRNRLFCTASQLHKTKNCNLSKVEITIINIMRNTLILLSFKQSYHYAISVCHVNRYHLNIYRRMAYAKNENNRLQWKTAMQL